MKVSREQAAESRERILDAAAKLYREHGFAGIGVADLMKQAGLTHGGFYGHFASKDELIAEACTRAASETVERWTRAAARLGDAAFADIQRSYLSARHRDNPGSGCLLAAVGSDVHRQSDIVKQSVTDGVTTMVDQLAQVAPGRNKAAKREKAIRTFATMIGAMTLARAVDDPKLANEILAAAFPVEAAAT